MTKLRILLADDHLLVAESLRLLLASDYEVLDIAQDGQSLVSMAEKYNPDIIITDISMPLLSGLNAAEQLKQQGLAAKIIFITQHLDIDYAIRAFEIGASGYVLKHSASSELLAALNELQKESIYISPQLDCNVGDLMKIHASKRSGSLIELTDRQREVLQLLAEGCSAKEAAAVLNTSPRTVEYHKYRLMDMLEIDSSAKLVQYAIKQGIASGIS